MVEHGLITELYKQAEVFFDSQFKQEFRMFFTVQEYLDDYTSVINLRLQNFRLLFELYFLVQAVLCAMFGLDTLLRLWKRRNDRKYDPVDPNGLARCATRLAKARPLKRVPLERPRAVY